MSQSATFYPIDREDFAAIKDDPQHLDLLGERKNYVRFQGTQEGLRYLLSKTLKDQDADLVNEIFSPATYIGEASTVYPDAEEAKAFVDETDDDEYEDADREPIPYHSPGKVKQVASLLDSIPDLDFLSLFDPEELDRQKIYPWCWKSSQENDRTFNEKHILEDFQKLKQLFKSAGERDRYLLCFLG